MSTPAVSVVIPTYNYAHFILSAIESVRGSDYPQEKVQIVVVDDGSTDGTEETLKSELPHIDFTYQENRGKAAATRVGIERATGDYLFTLDADDAFDKNRIRRAIELFEQESSLVHIAHPARYKFLSSGIETIERIPSEFLEKQLSGKWLLRELYFRNLTFGAGSTFSARLSAIRNFQIPDAVDMFIDEYLLLHTLVQGDSFLFEDPLSSWTVHGENFSDNVSSPEKVEEKNQRTISSMRAVGDSLEKSKFGPELPCIYELKLQAGELNMKERSNSKSFGDIISLLTSVLSSIPILKRKIFSVLYQQNVYQRMLPTSLLRILKKG